MGMRGRGRVRYCRGGFEEGKSDISLLTRQSKSEWGKTGGSGKKRERRVGFAL
jgi:hypothetical protein